MAASDAHGLNHSRSQKNAPRFLRSCRRECPRAQLSLCSIATTSLVSEVVPPTCRFPDVLELAGSLPPRPLVPAQGFSRLLAHASHLPSRRTATREFNPRVSSPEHFPALRAYCGGGDRSWRVHSQLSGLVDKGTGLVPPFTDDRTYIHKYAIPPKIKAAFGSHT